MEFVIVTGLSGAGKTRAMHAMEDIGFFCVDNLPPALIPVFYDLCLKTEGTQNRAAVVTDTRGGELFKSFFTAHGIPQTGQEAPIRSCSWTPPTACW